MKRNVFIMGILFVLALMVACNHLNDRSVETRRGTSLPTSASPELCAVDSLMWHQPDSALMRLLPYFNDTCCRDVSRNVSENANNDTLEDVSGNVSTTTAYNRHYAHLLLAELLYKNDYAQTNRTELLQAVTYFDSLVRQAPPLKGGARRAGDSKTTSNLAFLDARAHYINGVGYYEQDSLVQACAEYLKTLEVMESHFNENELVGHKARFMAYNYNRLGYMFEEQLLAEPAIVCYKQSLCYCKRESTSIYGIPIILYKLGIQFDIAGRKDSAAIYYDKALAYMPDHDNIHYRDIMVNKALLAYNTGFCIDSVIKDLKYVVSLASDEEEKITRFLTIGNILFEEKQYDSARFYLETVFEQQEDIQSKILAAVNLCDIYLSEGDSVKARQYSSFLSGYTMKEIEKKTDVSKINEMFQDYLKQKQEKLSEKERENSIRKTIGIIVPIAIAVALAIIILAKLRGKKLLRDKEKRHQEEMESERQTHRMEQAAMSGRLKRSNQEVRELKDQIKQQSNTAAKTGQAVSFMDEPICRLIMERVNEGQFKSQMDCTLYKDYALGKEQMTTLREATDRHFGQFTVRLKKAYPELTHGDLDYCCLYLLGLSDADISALMQRAYNTVNERNSKLRRIFGSENAISITLQAIANESISI